MRIVLATDSLKGTLGSLEAAALLEAAAHRHLPGCECVTVPMADGGEGTARAVVAATGGELRHTRASDPLGRPVEAEWGLLPGGRAIVEMATASGLTLLSPTERDPLRTSTYGTGELVRAALDAGARDVTLAVGGSATNDGGMGCLRALGARFLDADGRELAGTGADLGHVSSVDLASLDPRVGRIRFRLMCDVTNPLLGPSGAAAVFAPQKGADARAVDTLEKGMRSYAGVLEAACGRDPDVPGAGAAGGLAAGAMALLGARARSGIECVLELVGFDGLLAGADLCVTGEGRLDAQTAGGKVVSGVAAACARAGVPCVAVVGGVAAGPAPADSAGSTDISAGTATCGIEGLTAVVPTAPGPISLDEALARAPELYAAAAERLFALVALGRGLAG